MSTPANGPVGRPPVVDMASWQTARDELLAREKAHTREGDAIAAARRRLPMVEVDGSALVIGPVGPVPFRPLFEGRDRLVVYQHMWHDGAPHQGQCEGCTTTAWHLHDATYLHAHGVSLAILTTGRWEEVHPCTAFMGYRRVPWFSVREAPAPIGGDMGYLASFVRDGERVFLTYRTTGRGNERVNFSMGLLDLAHRRRGHPHLGRDQQAAAAVGAARSHPGRDAGPTRSAWRCSRRPSSRVFSGPVAVRSGALRRRDGSRCASARGPCRDTRSQRHPRAWPAAASAAAPGRGWPR